MKITMSNNVETTAVEKKSMIEEFVAFVRKYGVLGLAIGFVTGKAAADFVAILSSKFIQPLVGWVLSFVSPKAFAALNVAINDQVVFGFGDILKGLIDFLAIMLVIFILVKFVFSKLMNDTDHAKV